MQPGPIAIGFALAAALLLAEHVALWNQPWRLKEPWTYLVGVSTLAVGWVAWALSANGPISPIDAAASIAITMTFSHLPGRPIRSTPSAPRNPPASLPIADTPIGAPSARKSAPVASEGQWTLEGLTRLIRAVREQQEQLIDEAYALVMRLAERLGTLDPYDITDLTRVARLQYLWGRAMNRWQRRQGKPQTYCCRNCHQMHATQQCPEIRARLFAPEADTVVESTQTFNLLYGLTHGLVTLDPVTHELRAA